MKIISRKQIEQILSIPTVLQAIEQGFVIYSRGETVIPPVASLHFDHPPGDCHIKYGYAKSGKYYVVKIASGFHDNPKIGLPAVGTDDVGKQEIDPEIFMKADRVVVDSRIQCMQFGDVSYAIRQNLVKEEQLIELGEMIEDSSLGRNSETEITVADLTGVAIQDLQIAAVVFDQITALHGIK